MIIFFYFYKSTHLENFIYNMLKIEIMEKIPKWSERKFWNSLISPVIIHVKSGKLEEFVSNIKDYIFDIPYIGKLINRVITPERIKIIEEKIIPIKHFDYVAMPLPRELIWALESEKYIKRIYYDYDVMPLDGPMPTVEKEGIYEFLIVDKFKVKGTSTFWIKRLVGAYDANNEGFCGYGMKVSVCDTGAFPLPGMENIKLRKVVGVSDIDVANGHGEWVASAVMSKHVLDSNNVYKYNIPVEGMAPGVDCWSIKCLEFYGGKTSWVIKAIEDSVFKYNVDVMNFSLGGPLEVRKPEDDPLFLPFKVSCELNKIACVASGNSGKGNLCSPGSLPVVLRVGAYDPVKGVIAKFTSRGITPWKDIVPDIVEPGVWIDSRAIGECDIIDSKINEFSALSGTSMATPIATGLVSLMKEAHMKLLGKQLTLDEIILMMTELGEFPNKDENYGYGILTWYKYKKWLSTQYGIEF